MTPESVAEDDYRSFCEALGSSARGRAFLEEFTRRNRQADTEVVLTALRRIEETARKQAAASPEAERMRQDLRALLDTLRAARPQSDNSPTAIKAATLAALIDFAQARIEALVLMPAASSEADALAAVPALEQPELPIPHPAAAAAPIMALVQSAAPVRPEPNAVAAQPFVSPHAKRKNATVIPIVEFDYRAHQSGRPASLWAPPEESWTALAPPAVSSPIVAPIAAPVPPVAEPKIATPDVAEPDTALLPKAAPAATPATEVETYELWLDPPAVARTESETPASAGIVSDLVPDLASVSERVLSQVTNHVPSEMMLPDMAVGETGLAQTVTAETVVAETAIAETAVSDTANSDAVMTETAPQQAGNDAVPTAQAAISTIETLMQQMESAATPAPAVKGHAEVPDPLAPLMALSEEERIALFT